MIQFKKEALSDAQKGVLSLYSPADFLSGKEGERMTASLYQSHNPYNPRDGTGLRKYVSDLGKFLIDGAQFWACDESNKREAELLLTYCWSRTGAVRRTQLTICSQL